LPDNPSQDTSKLKKHIGLVLERLAKGMRMTLDPEDVNGGVQVIGGGGALGRSKSTKQNAVANE
jgi:hypothetical protein